MLTPKQNALAIMNGEQPDYYDDITKAMGLIRVDHSYKMDFVVPDGEIHQDSWGVSFQTVPGSPGQHPIATPELLVIKDIENWEKDVVVPDLEAFDWSEAKAAADQVDRDEYFVTAFMPGGLFERSHHLMGFENALINYLTYEEEMAALLRVIADQRIAHINKVAEVYQPEMLFYQDDWGSKLNVFLPPDLWRRLIKPLHTEIVAAAHAHNMIFVHHADCYVQPLIPDFLDMEIDVWQGAIPQNDIVEIQRIVDGKMAIQGGIDGPVIDQEGVDEEIIRAEVRRAIDTYCPAGYFFSGLPNVRCNFERCQDIMRDEIETYGTKWAQEHPIK